MASAGLSIDKASFDGDGDILQAPDGTIWLTFDDNAAGAGIRVDQLTPNADVTLTGVDSGSVQNRALRPDWGSGVELRSLFR